MQKSIHTDTTHLRDYLIKMNMLCQEFEVTALAVDIQDMDEMFNNYTPILGKAFQEYCFMYN